MVQNGEEFMTASHIHMRRLRSTGADTQARGGYKRLIPEGRRGMMHNIHLHIHSPCQVCMLTQQTTLQNER